MFSKHNIIFLKCTLIGVIVLAFTACNEERSTLPPPPDVSHIEVDIDIHRFEKDLMALDTSDLDTEIDELKRKYPQFLECYIEDVMRLGIVSDTTLEYKVQVRELLKYGGFRAAYDSTMKRYEDVEPLEQQLEQSLAYYRYYFPDSVIPDIVTFISEYGYGVISCGDSTIGIGLDLFLGQSFSYYGQIGIPAYLLPKFEREYIAPNVLKAMAINMVNAGPEGNTLLAQMIHNGKVLYFLDLVMPKTPDHIKIGYTEDQLKWLRENESEVWAYFLGENLLYNTTRMTINRFTSEGPGTPGLPMEAPGNVGSWLGWQIVRKYMAKYEGLSYEQLIERRDAQEILERSNYKPR